MMKNYILNTPNLNAKQREAIEYCNGPSIIIASAGSGKTRVLTYKISYLIDKLNISPFNILALTFTNKAAREMSKRIESIIGSSSRSLWLGTFHSIFAKILRIEAEKLGYTRNFIIYDRDDSKSVIKSIIKELNLDDKIYNANIVVSRISSAKNRLFSAESYSNDLVCQEEDKSSKRPFLGKIFSLYESRCFKSGAMDFDDILVNTYNLFNKNLEILYKYQEKFKFILIDEFQDTNILQYKIIKDLSSIHNKICVVGDDAQSIYAFRGANIYNILNFQKDFLNSKTFKLVENYRSTKNIVGAANSVIKHNKNQIKKDAWTENESGELLDIYKYLDNGEEAQRIAESILNLHLKKQINYDKFAILCRTNYQFRSLEEEFRKVNIPYKIVGGISFYQRKEIKDMLAYFKFILNPNDVEAFKRIINLPKRGVGKTTLDKITIASNDNNMSLWETLQNINHFVSSKIATSISEFTNMIESLKIQSEKLNAYDAAMEIAKRTGILKYFLEDKSSDSNTKYENLQELLNSIKNFTEASKNLSYSNLEFNDEMIFKKTSLSLYIQEVSLISSWDESDEKSDSKPQVNIMTIHASKGLEFDYVYLPGMEEQLFPSGLMLSSQDDLEEERRLFYVALTRAKKKVILSHVLRRFKFGKYIECEESRFLNEVSDCYIRVNNFHFNESLFKNKKTNNLAIKNNSSKIPFNKVNSHYGSLIKNFKSDDISNFKENQLVEHQKFGRGKICSLQNMQGTLKAIVDFENHGKKTLLLNFAKLQILE